MRVVFQDLAQYSKFREKAAAAAARSLVALFRELAPGMLEKKDRGRGADMSAVPLAYGQSKGLDRIPGAHLLEQAISVLFGLKVEQKWLS